MVAVALLPPLVASGLLLGSGHWQQAVGAMLLLVTNLTCINLAGVISFLAEGIQPLKWWEADKAQRATRVAIVLWTLVLSVLLLLVLVSQRT